MMTIAPVSYTHLDVYKRQLQLLAGQVVAFTVFDEHSASLDKAECYVGIHAFLPERLDPIKIAGAGTIVV